MPLLPPTIGVIYLHSVFPNRVWRECEASKSFNSTDFGETSNLKFLTPLKTRTLKIPIIQALLKTVFHICFVFWFSPFFFLSENFFKLQFYHFYSFTCVIGGGGWVGRDRFMFLYSYSIVLLLSLTAPSLQSDIPCPWWCCCVLYTSHSVNVCHLAHISNKKLMFWCSYPVCWDVCGWRKKMRHQEAMPGVLIASEHTHVNLIYYWFNYWVSLTT